MYYPPFVMFVFVLYTFLLAAMFGFLYVGALEYAFTSLGLSKRVIFGLLLVSLFGSTINIPLMKLQSRPKVKPKVISFLGRRFYFPSAVNRNRTLLAVNLGGCVVPVVLSAYLLYNHLNLLMPVVLSTILVTMVVNNFSRLVEGVGVTVPLFLPPVIAVLGSLLLTEQQAPLVAYVSGTLGTLIGADLLNLNQIKESGAPVASIGGAGTFDGVFLTGIIAVLLASLTVQ